MGHSQGAMKNLHAATTVKIPEGVTVDIKSRAVVVKGPRGTLSKSFKHMQIDLFKPKDEKTGIQIENIIKIEKWFSLSKEQSAIKTCSSHIQDMINFIGQKVKFHVDAYEGVKIERDPKANTELLISGNDIESVSKTCALINQSCSVKRKDIRKFLDGVYVAEKGNIIED